MRQSRSPGCGRRSPHRQGGTEGAHRIAKARAATIRRDLIAVAARTARYARSHVTLYLPEGWHRQHEWQNLFAAACGPRQSGLTSPDRPAPAAPDGHPTPDPGPGTPDKPQNRRATGRWRPRFTSENSSCRNRTRKSVYRNCPVDRGFVSQRRRRTSRRPRWPCGRGSGRRPRPDALPPWLMTSTSPRGVPRRRFPGAKVLPSEDLDPLS